MGFIPKSWGEYPPEYNRAVHGPYDPARYYGKPDTPFGDVKLGELTAWLGRRNKSPKAMMGAISRAWFTYFTKWVTPKKPGLVFIYQFSAASIIFNYWLEHNRLKHHRNYRYH